MPEADGNEPLQRQGGKGMEAEQPWRKPTPDKRAHQSVKVPLLRNMAVPLFRYREFTEKKSIGNEAGRQNARNKSADEPKINPKMR